MDTRLLWTSMNAVGANNSQKNREYAHNTSKRLQTREFSPFPPNLYYVNTLARPTRLYRLFLYHRHLRHLFLQ